MSQSSEIAFAKWLQANDPFLFEVAKKRAQIQKTGSINGLGFLTDINWGDLAKSAIETVKNVAPALASYKAQSKILKVQLANAKAGLPPINAADYAPTVKVAAEITPEMEAAATRVAQESVRTGMGHLGQYMPLVLAGGLAFFLLNKKRR